MLAIHIYSDQSSIKKTIQSLKSNNQPQVADVSNQALQIARQAVNPLDGDFELTVENIQTIYHAALADAAQNSKLENEENEHVWQRVERIIAALTAKNLLPALKTLLSKDDTNEIKQGLFCIYYTLMHHQYLHYSRQSHHDAFYEWAYKQLAEHNQQTNFAQFWPRFYHFSGHLKQSIDKARSSAIHPQDGWQHFIKPTIKSEFFSHASFADRMDSNDSEDEDIDYYLIQNYARGSLIIGACLSIIPIMMASFAFILNRVPHQPFLPHFLTIIPIFVVYFAIAAFSLGMVGTLLKDILHYSWKTPVSLYRYHGLRYAIGIPVALIMAILCYAIGFKVFFLAIGKAILSASQALKLYISKNGTFPILSMLGLFSGICYLVSKFLPSAEKTPAQTLEQACLQNLYKIEENKDFETYINTYERNCKTTHPLRQISLKQKLWKFVKNIGWLFPSLTLLYTSIKLLPIFYLPLTVDYPQFLPQLWLGLKSIGHVLLSLKVSLIILCWVTLRFATAFFAKKEYENVSENNWQKTILERDFKQTSVYFSLIFFSIILKNMHFVQNLAGPFFFWFPILQILEFINPLTFAVQIDHTGSLLQEVPTHIPRVIPLFIGLLLSCKGYALGPIIFLLGGFIAYKTLAKAAAQSKDEAAVLLATAAPVAAGAGLTAASASASESELKSASASKSATASASASESELKSASASKSATASASESESESATEEEEEEEEEEESISLGSRIR
jgi:hypothetical protein